ncbi:hypothetical protein J5N97_026714 [Dioscorea zingiberensis]|uniref:UDP-sugar pyrophosphorylase n=1 Tax=Dioscorea zingiberensis TaxID=325984 RepID=A0A9D5C2R6_9LILI|nr:hypothetical protein J5N97_026714 [Dioscorea zingiberensis]
MASEVTEKLSEICIGDDLASSAPNLMKNLSILSSDQIELAKMLLSEGQSHLFSHWPEPGVDDDKKKGFFDQVARLNSSYPGGLVAYIQNARRLLADSKAGKNPYDGFTPSVPSGEILTFGDDNFNMLEETGVREAHKAAFVLVAGGLGERLGYKGIKLALPLETATGRCFLQHYIESILALQEASCKLVQGPCNSEIPLVIMTSDDTHAPTLKLLESNSYFGMKPTQVKLLKQEKVACLDDNDARLALDANDKFKIQTKPHGHGDVHALLYSSGLLNQWHDAGLRWVLFFQDTNGLLFKAIPAALGVSSTKEYHVNSLAVPRKAKEAIGGITKLTHADGRTMVINVEYNQLDPLLRATGHADGDVNCETGYSPFPGNINQLILELQPYIEELTKTQGAIAEFVNPKYKDSSKTSFKSSTRLECMMQDYPKTLPPSARVGFTVMDTWLAYAPVKNNPEDASKVPKGNPYHSATSGEMAIYRANSLILKKAGVKIADPVVDVFNAQEVEVWPRITWSPKWASTYADVKRKVNEKCSVSQRSTLVLKGQNVILDELSLDGTLIVNAVDEAEVQQPETSPSSPLKLSVRVLLISQVVMAGMAPEGTQFNAQQYDTKMNELLSADGQEFFTFYDEVYDTFDSMGLQENLLRGIYAYGFEKPSAIQQRGIVPFCKGLDVIQQAQSGTGKTATFCSGILQQLDYGLVECQALVLAPTRELAQQIEKVMRALGDYLGVKVHACVGGTSVREDQRILSSGVHVVVGTPGRVFDMLRRQALRPDHIKMFVLDEADEMLSRGFKDQIYDIFQLLPSKVQVGVFSATMPPEALEITLDWLTDKMRSRDHTVSATHGDMDQNTRDIIMREFRSGSSRVLITTDLLARGIDVQQVSLVINYDLPTQPENYLHRIGRSGRFGRKGVAINFVTQDDERMLFDIQRFYNVVIEELPSNVADLL